MHKVQITLQMVFGTKLQFLKVSSDHMQEGLGRGEGCLRNNCGYMSTHFFFDKLTLQHTRDPDPYRDVQHKDGPSPRTPRRSTAKLRSTAKKEKEGEKQKRRKIEKGSLS